MDGAMLQNATVSADTDHLAQRCMGAEAKAASTEVASNIWARLDLVKRPDLASMTCEELEALSRALETGRGSCDQRIGPACHIDSGREWAQTNWAVQGTRR